MIQAKITDIKADSKLEFAVVGVEVSNNGKKYQKAYKIALSQEITFENIRTRVIDDVIKDIKQESRINDNIKELEKHTGIPFNIELPSTSKPNKDDK